MLNTPDGQVQTMKVKALPDVSPAQVQVALNQAVDDAMKQLYPPDPKFSNLAIDDPGQDPAVQTLRLPTQPLQRVLQTIEEVP